MFILTTDDGYNSEGYKALIESALKVIPEEELFLIAPDSERSASSHGLTFFKPIFLEERSLIISGNKLRIIVTDGTPADNVLIAMSYFLKSVNPSEITVISGINRGANLGFDIHYSGTISAAREGAIKGGFGIAFSLAEYLKPDYSTSLTFVSSFLRAFVENRSELDFLRFRGVLSFNIPPLGKKAIRGVLLTDIGRSFYNDRAVLRYNPRGKPYFWLGGDYPWGEQIEGNDFWAISEGYISLSVVALNPSLLGNCLKETEIQRITNLLRKAWDYFQEEGF